MIQCRCIYMYKSNCKLQVLPKRKGKLSFLVFDKQEKIGTRKLVLKFIRMSGENAFSEMSGNLFSNDVFSFFVVIKKLPRIKRRKLLTT